ncbi:MAG: FG-GAP repeat domain-containing protein [Candidatus Bipolaricaulaceae bacterium]
MKWWVWLVLVPLAVVTVFYGHDLLVGVYFPYSAPAAPHPRYPELGQAWSMHPVDNPGDWLPNGLDVADVDFDGFPDFLVNYEWTGRIRVVFHPGPALSPGQPWSGVDVGFFPNAENSAFGDLDMDGMFDVVVVQGAEQSGGTSGVRLLFGQGGSRLAPGGRALSWEDRGVIPESLGLGHYLYVKVADLALPRRGSPGSPSVAGIRHRPHHPQRPWICSCRLQWRRIFGSCGQ